MDAPELVEVLVAAVGPGRDAAGIAFSSTYRAPGGGKVFPPTYPTGRDTSPYLFEQRWLDGDQREVVILDQVPSQANRVEAALLEARDKGEIALPLFELHAETTWGPLRLTSLEFPHRFADAYLRDSVRDGTPFDRTEAGRALRSASEKDLRAQFSLSPESLLYGAWDSHRKGRGVKLPRIYTSSVLGLDPVEGERRSGRMDPFNLVGAVDDSGREDWQFKAVEKGTKKVKERLSELGHGNIAPNAAPGGVAITEARRSAWLSVAGLARLRFGDASAEAGHLARATLAALALAGDRLAFGGPSLWLRSGCDLVRTGESVVIERADGQTEPLEVSATTAVAAFAELSRRTAEAGIAMSSETVRLGPRESLAQAIEFATTRATSEDGGEE